MPQCDFNCEKKFKMKKSLKDITSHCEIKVKLGGKVTF